ncbi:MAG TPA: outer membrane protein assembly factor BamE [Geminicoccaceae bacterium]|nr:outer membrane protein assembly factor BamE [Geminicoccaceae bacterium]
MARTGSPIPIFALALGLAACAPEVSTHGYRLDDAALARLEPGRTTRDEALQLLGSPSSVATFDERVWYYVTQRTERMSFYQEEVVDQQVLAITFDDSGVVRDIERQELADARQLALVDRETPTSGSELSMLEQFLGNLGRFNPEEDPDAR